ncbi:MAG TPA: hypothetical protein VMV18_15370 [bacterium]|nr:hypothetical protein [bacterium]
MEILTTITPKILDLLRKDSSWDSKAEAVAVLRKHKKRRAADEIEAMSDDEFSDFVANADLDADAD